VVPIEPERDVLGYRVLRSIRRIIRRVANHSRELARETGLTVPQLLCLRAVDDLGAGAMPAQVAAAVQLSPSTVSGVIDRLVRAELLNRHRSDRDRRVVVLGITELGRARLDGMPLPLQDSFLARLAALEPHQREQILAALEQVVALMDATDLDAAPVLVDGADMGDR